MKIEDILYRLLELPYSKKLNNGQIAIRCPICGDSVKHENSAHCYVGLYKGELPLVYHCWINECSGVVDNNFLKACGIYDNNMACYLATLKGSNKRVSKIITDEMRYNIRIPYTFNERKYAYLYNRLGIEFSPEELSNLKVIFSLEDFVEYNDLEVSISNRLFELLNNDYIGFLSNNREYIIFRNICNNDNLRYYNYSVFNQDNNGNRFYTIKSECDLLSNNIELNISEGIFDIISVYFNIKKGNDINNIYAAVCGSGYINVIKSIIRKGFTELTINIYSDKDKKSSYYNNIKNELKLWYKDINIFYNGYPKEKDFGVIPEKIKIIKNV